MPEVHSSSGKGLPPAKSEDITSFACLFDNYNCESIRMALHIARAYHVVIVNVASRFEVN